MIGDTANVGSTEAVRQLVIFTLDIEKYATPINEVREVVKGAEVTPVPGSPAYIVGVVNLRGKIIPILDLEKLFSLERKTAYPSVLLLLVVEYIDGTLFGIQVDHVTKIMKVVGDAIQPAPSMVTARISADYVEGVVVTGDTPKAGMPAVDDVILLLSLQNIITKEIMNTVVTAAAATTIAEAPETPETPEILSRPAITPTNTEEQIDHENSNS